MEQFNITDMTCGGCAHKVTAALQGVDPQCQVQIDLPTKQVHVQSQLPRQALVQALEGAGFTPTDLAPT
jgi:copper chaperone